MLDERGCAVGTGVGGAEVEQATMPIAVIAIKKRCIMVPPVRRSVTGQHYADISALHFHK